jgi:hypothetical protein
MENMIKIAFTKSEGDLVYSDALYLELDHTFTETEIEAMKQERFDNWLNFLKNPPTQIIPVGNYEDIEKTGNTDTVFE